MSIEAPPLERKLVAILAADVEGYSRMMHQDEVATLETLTARRRVVDELIGASGGQVRSTAGDSVLAEFASAVEAVNCAIKIQQAVTSANEELPPEQRMEFRIGINVGDVMVKDGGIFGDGVNVASRVEALAPPGGICVTRGIRDHVRESVDFGFDDMGDHSVKNIARPVHVFRVVFDPAELAALPAAPAEAEALTTERSGAVETSVDDSEAIELAFWNSVEGGGTTEEYEAYLERYPEGRFAALAALRLSKPADTTPAKDQSVELAFWDSVADSEDPSMFEAYLEKYPEGEFAAIAQLRLKTLVAAKSE